MPFGPGYDLRARLQSCELSKRQVLESHLGYYYYGHLCGSFGKCGSFGEEWWVWEVWQVWEVW
jgi:hypothetical protein